MIENITIATKAAERSVGFIKGMKSQANPHSAAANQLPGQDSPVIICCCRYDYTNLYIDYLIYGNSYIII